MEDISLHILDIAENSINAGATLIKILITEDRDRNTFNVTIEDNGRGMAEAFMERVLDPFCTTRTTRKIGLGLSLLAQSARETGGDIRIRSVVGKGTVISADFRPDHIDMRPLGNMVDTLMTLIAGNPETAFHFCYTKGFRVCTLDTQELQADLEGVPINTAAVLSAIRKGLSEDLAELQENPL